MQAHWREMDLGQSREMDLGRWGPWAAATVCAGTRLDRGRCPWNFNRHMATLVATHSTMPVCRKWLHGTLHGTFVQALIDGMTVPRWENPPCERIPRDCTSLGYSYKSQCPSAENPSTRLESTWKLINHGHGLSSVHYQSHQTCHRARRFANFERPKRGQIVYPYGRWDLEMPGVDTITG